MSIQQSIRSFVLMVLVALTGCERIVQDFGGTPQDAGSDAQPVDRVREACRSNPNQVLMACTVPERSVELGQRNARLFQLALFSCGVPVTLRAAQISLGRNTFPGAGGFRGLLVGSRGTDYFSGLEIIDGMEGGTITYTLVGGDNIFRTVRFQPEPVEIADGNGRYFVFRYDIAEREDRVDELVGPEFRFSLSSWWSENANEALEVVDRTGAPIPRAWLRDAPWSSGCIDPRDFVTVRRPVMIGIGPSDAGR